MQKLLSITLLLAGCTLQFASAQNASPLLGNVPATTLAYPSPSEAPSWVGAEFSEAYGRYFLNLPQLFKYTVSQTLRGAPLLAPHAAPASILAQDEALRERVYQAIYQYCHTVKYGLGDSQNLEELVYLMLYNDFHLSDLAATQLTPHILSRYTQPAPPPTYAAPPTGAKVADKSATGQAARLPGPLTSANLYGTSKTATAAATNNDKAGLDMTGWQLDYIPPAAFVDDRTGTIRFRIKVNNNGEVESVTRVSSSVSIEQEKCFREALFAAHFTKTDATATVATGFYTIRYTVR